MKRLLALAVSALFASTGTTAGQNCGTGALLANGLKIVIC